jgi:NTE family protein
MVHNVALVLGGGGAAGNAWLIGIIAGLAEAGRDITEAADLVIGTSAGATAAAQVRSGIPPAELLASLLSPPAQPVRQNLERLPSLPMATVFEWMRDISATATSAANLQRAMGAFGLESDSILEPWAGQRRATVAARLPRPEWPDRPMIVTAIDAHTVADFVKERSVLTAVQLIGAAFLIIVVFAHLAETYALLPSMGWGLPHSVGHYIDLASAFCGLLFLSGGYLMRRLRKRTV